VSDVRSESTLNDWGLIIQINGWLGTNFRSWLWIIKIVHISSSTPSQP